MEGTNESTELGRHPKWILLECKSKFYRDIMELYLPIKHYNDLYTWTNLPTFTLPHVGTIHLTSGEASLNPFYLPTYVSTYLRIYLPTYLPTVADVCLLCTTFDSKTISTLPAFFFILVKQKTL